MMTPDTAALRARPERNLTVTITAAERDALCDAADEVERLREEVRVLDEQVVGMNEADIASRTAHAALVAELRALHAGTHACHGGWYTDDPAYRGTVAKRKPCPDLALLDRHAPEKKNSASTAIADYEKKRREG